MMWVSKFGFQDAGLVNERKKVITRDWLMIVLSIILSLIFYNS